MIDKAISISVLAFLAGVLLGAQPRHRARVRLRGRRRVMIEDIKGGRRIYRMVTADRAVLGEDGVWRLKENSHNGQSVNKPGVS